MLQKDAIYNTVTIESSACMSPVSQRFHIQVTVILLNANQNIRIKTFLLLSTLSLGSSKRLVKDIIPDRGP